MTNEYKLSSLAQLVNGELSGDGDYVISTLASIASAGPDGLSFFDNPKLTDQLKSTRAGCVIIGPDQEAPESLNVIRVGQPVVAWATILDLLHPRKRVFDKISDDAFIGEDVQFGEGAGVGPGAWIGDGARIGAGTEIFPGATVGDGATLGEDCIIYAGVHIYHQCSIGNRVIIHSGAVIGSDGYGFAQENTGDTAEPVVHKKIQQIGNVVIEDDVEIGANTTIDRAALDSTVIGKGTKIDNQVVIGHNVNTGRHCLLISQVGIAGSSTLGNYVTLAGQSGVNGHTTIGDGAIVGGKSGVMQDLEGGKIYLGIPARSALATKRAYALIDKLPEYTRKLRALEKKIAELEGEDPPGA